MVESKLIERICGLKPSDFVKASPTDSNFVFQNDPNFPPLNLYDFFGRAATVNSYKECFYYVELGFEPTKTTIFDIGIIIFQIVLSVFVIYKLHKKGYLKKIITSLSSFSNKDINKIFYFVFPVLISFQGYFIFDYVRTKAVRIPRFIDEYITLTSSFNFFKSLNFNAGDFLGGNYAVQITSGPISAVGSVIGWSITDKLIVARISNFFWICFLQLIFSFLLIKLYKTDFKFLFFANGLTIVLIPWWHGSLYSLGEIPSVIIFVNAVFLFYKLRKFSMILFSLSIFYGKLLNLVPFVGFYLIVIFYEKNLKNILKDAALFFAPLSLWLLIVSYKYEKGGLFQYINDQYNFIINHQSSGAPTESASFFNNFTDSLLSSEFSTWNSFDKGRLTIVPILFLLVLLKNKEDINTYFGKITVPLSSSIMFSYIWFWVLNDTKWIRHTQHFIVPLLIGILYFLNFNVIKSKIDLLILVSIFSVFIENNKYFILILFFSSLFIIYFSSKRYSYLYLKILLSTILFIDISIPYFEKDSFGNMDHIIEDCKIELISSECRSAYLNE